MGRIAVAAGPGGPVAVNRRSPAAVRAALTATVLLVGGAGWVHAEPTPFGNGLPPPVLEALHAAAQRAERHPALLRASLRHERAGPAATSRPAVDAWAWEVDGRLSRPWSGGWYGDARLSLSLDVVDPSLERRAAEARSTGTLFDVERALARRDAALEALTTVLALWNTRQRLGLLEEIRATGPSRRAETSGLHAWLADAPSLRLDARILADRLARSTDGTDHAPLARDAWSSYLAGPIPDGCPNLAPGVRLARADAEAHRARVSAERTSVSLPSVVARASIGVAATGDPDRPFDPRVTLGLDVGAPASWPISASATLGVDDEATSLHLRAADDDPSPNAWHHEDAALERAERMAAVDTSLRAAEERVALERLALHLAADELALPFPTIATPDDLEAAYAWLAWTVRAVEVRARLTIDCEGPFAQH